MKLVCMVEDWEPTADGMVLIDLIYVMDLMPTPGKVVKVSERQLKMLQDGRMKHLLIEV